MDPYEQQYDNVDVTAGSLLPAAHQLQPSPSPVEPDDLEQYFGPDASAPMPSQMQPAPAPLPPAPPRRPPPLPHVQHPQYRQPMYSQAIGQSPDGAGHMLGLSVLAVAVGATVGARTGGLPGAGAGMLFGGAAVNAYRAVRQYAKGTEEADREGRISVFYSLVGAVGGGVVWYRYVKSKRFESNPEPDDSIEVVATDRVGPCKIRPAGP